MPQAGGEGPKWRSEPEPAGKALRTLPAPAPGPDWLSLLCPMSPTSRPTPWEQDSPAGWGRGAGWLADSDLQTKCAQVSPAPAAAPRLRFRVPASPGSAHLPATHSFTHHCDHPPPSPSRSPSSLCPSGNRSTLCPPPQPSSLWPRPRLTSVPRSLVGKARQPPV